MVRSLIVGLVVVLQGACSDGSSQGELNAHCYPNGTCNVGLSCHAGTCEPADAAIPDAAIDASDAFIPFQCADDSVFEGASGNETVGTASTTPVATVRTSITYAGLAICPDGDKDTYRIDITTTGQNLHAEITYEPISMGGVELSVSILNNTGAPIANGSPMAGNKVDVSMANLPAGSSPYHVQVYGPVTGKNNYQLFLEVTGP